MIKYYMLIDSLIAKPDYDVHCWVGLYCEFLPKFYLKF